MGSQGSGIEIPHVNPQSVVARVGVLVKNLEYPVKQTNDRIRHYSALLVPSSGTLFSCGTLFSIWYTFFSCGTLFVYCG